MITRLKCALWIAVMAVIGNFCGAQSTAFFDQLTEQAKASAKQGYKPATKALPDALKNLSYDAYMGIQYRRDKSVWRGQSKFELQFFHPGYLYPDPVRIHLLEDGRDREVQFSPELFDYGSPQLTLQTPSNLFFAGVRILYPVNEPTKMDEIAVFLGTSFFRVLGSQQFFGTSLRGLAIDTGEASGEEFPRFSEFWITKPGPLAQQIQIFARLDSRRVVGAYQFLIKPGGVTVVDVEARLFFREEIKKLGIAPVTGMYFFGEDRTRSFPDFRPEVHDADGLLLESPSRGWEWRPLVNPIKVHHISTFADAKGFGLLQRDRNGDHYQDLEANYESRPSYWVSPEGDWGPGRIELVEIPTTEERHDNIVTYWVPDKKGAPGQELRFRYKLHAFLTEPERPPSKLFKVRDTRLQIGKGGRARFVIDYDGGTGPGAIVANVHTAKGKLENIVTQPNKMLDGWRLFFDLVPEGDKPIELRAQLRRGDQPASETWVYHFTPP